jgi:electron transfer flavoprotein alpha subunit
MEKARQLAAETGGALSAALLGSGCAGLARQLIYAGASRVYVADDPALALYQSDLYPAVLAGMLKETKPDAALFGGTAIGTDLAPRTAAILKTGLTAHCIDLRIEQIEGKETFVQVVPGWGGNMMLKIVCPERRPQMATVRPGVLEAASPDTSRPGEVIAWKADIPAQKIRARTLEFVREESGSAALEEADVIVSGGFGLESAGGFALVEELAAALHGEVAGTRPAFDRGWIPEFRMIGQSGKTVSPKLFLSVGASGATHYTTGFMKAKVIAAIDKNPKAPIFDIADIGIAGDLKKIIPCLINELKTIK